MNPGHSVNQGISCMRFARGVLWIPCKASLSLWRLKILVVRNSNVPLPWQSSSFPPKFSPDQLDSLLFFRPWGGWIERQKASQLFAVAYLLFVFLEPPRKDAGITKPHISRELHSHLHYVLLCSKDWISLFWYPGHWGWAILWRSGDLQCSS